MRLIKKGQKGIIHAVFSRFGIIIALFLVNLFLLGAAFVWFEGLVPHLVGGSSLLAFVMSLVVLNSDINTSAKCTWLVLFVILPVFGAALYLYTESDFGHRALKKHSVEVHAQTAGELVQNAEVLQKMSAEAPEAASIAHYLRESSGFTAFYADSCTYYSDGEEKLEALLCSLSEAKKFIFLEYFIIEEGYMWGRVLEVLAKKAAQGVDVRVMYDGTCEFTTLPHEYPKKLNALGIKCKIFAPIMPFVSTHYNYRDHRKIAVIDGRTAFTGGINLADEYVNRKLRCGRWKDAAIKIEGEAVNSFTLMFLQMWGINEKQEVLCGYTGCGASSYGGGYIIPYGDCPADGIRTGERVYMHMLNNAKSYVHIMTPYLILDEPMETALRFAAERGVDVSLILPGIPDKKAPYALAKTHFHSLLAAGVKIYLYTPGFVHSKVFVSDGIKAVAGTVNLDYRSFYHHYECAAYMYGTECIADMERDFRETLKDCVAVTEQSVKKEKWYWRLAGFVLKVIAPLM